jgi:hypothetical protein
MTGRFQKDYIGERLAPDGSIMAGTAVNCRGCTIEVTTGSAGPFIQVRSVSKDR